jgi:hypothetical protein
MELRLISWKIFLYIRNKNGASIKSGCTLSSGLVLGQGITLGNLGTKLSKKVRLAQTILMTRWERINS